MLELKKRHAVPAQYRVHLYGGGNMFADRAASPMDIGIQNIEMAHRLLDKRGIYAGLRTLRQLRSPQGGLRCVEW